MEGREEMKLLGVTGSGMRERERRERVVGAGRVEGAARGREGTQGRGKGTGRGGVTALHRE